MLLFLLLKLLMSLKCTGSVMMENEFYDVELDDMSTSSCSMSSFPHIVSPEGKGQLLVHEGALYYMDRARKGRCDSMRRTIATALLTILVLVLLTSALLLATRKLLVPQQHFGPSEEINVIDFRRAEEEYILDPMWDYTAPPTVREYNFAISNIIGKPDGVYRPLIAINKQFPGPLIECNEGDVVRILVDNQSVNATSLHFHGIYQNGTNWMDGTSGVTQCSIAPGRTFQYVFNITGQSGTYYYHGHQGVQASDGLFGPLIVHSRRERIEEAAKHSSDRVIMVQDHYHDSSDALLFQAMRPGHEGAPMPVGALINGRNTRDCSQFSKRLCDNSSTSHATFDLDRNAAHRLRFINVGALAYFHVSLDAHSFTIVEADGTDLVPITRSRLLIAPSQRYSLILHPYQTSERSFWLRARMMTHCWGDNPAEATEEDGEVKAIVRYTAPSEISRHAGKRIEQIPVSKASPRNLMENCLDMTNLTPANWTPFPNTASKTYYLESNIAIGDWRLERGYFNTSSFRPNITSPTLHRVLTGLHHDTYKETFAANGVNDKFFNPTNELVIQHPNTEVVDIIIHNSDEQSHPIHLHGHKFFILGSGHTLFPGYEALGLSSTTKSFLPGYEANFQNVMSRDVATLQNFGWLAIRVVFDNPGAWAFHCHMSWHSEKGLGMVFLSKTDEMRGWEIPAANKALCAASMEDLERGMPPSDVLWEGDLETDGATE